MRPVDAIREPGKIFDHGGGGKLSTGLGAFKYQRTQVGAGSINRRGQTGAAAPDNDYLFHWDKFSTGRTGGNSGERRLSACTCRQPGGKLCAKWSWVFH